MIYVILAVGSVLGLFYLVPKKTDEESGGITFVKQDKLYGLKDISPDDQGGSFKKDHDIYFEAASDEFGVPFALLKAHAIVESSLNASAFRDENPSKRDDRIGWASRGLMQILWSPLEPKKGDNGVNRDRWVKYGYPAESLGIDGIRQFEPNVNIRIAAQLIKDNLKAAGGNLRDAINMYNTGKKEAVYAAPHDYVNKVLKNYNKMIGE